MSKLISRRQVFVRLERSREWHKIVMGATSAVVTAIAPFAANVSTLALQSSVTSSTTLTLLTRSSFMWLGATRRSCRGSETPGLTRDTPDLVGGVVASTPPPASHGADGHLRLKGKAKTKRANASRSWQGGTVGAPTRVSVGDLILLFRAPS